MYSIGWIDVSQLSVCIHVFFKSYLTVFILIVYAVVIKQNVQHLSYRYIIKYVSAGLSDVTKSAKSGSTTWVVNDR